MFRRILRVTLTFAAIVGAYQVYVTFAVPQMEPSISEREQRRADQASIDRARNAVSKYQVLLSHYFPKDHWSQVRPPKVFANSSEQTMLVIDDYTRHPIDDKLTRVDINKMAIVMFQTMPSETDPWPRDAIITEGNQGAHLVFDDFHPEQGRIGQITRGEFPGPILIHSDMRQPGPEDDLVIHTSDLKMNTKLLYSDQPVDFRLGQNYGSGRELEIRFLADEHVQPHESGLRISGFDSLEIRREVRMRLQLNTDTLMPGTGAKDAQTQPLTAPSAGPALGAASIGASPAVRVTDPGKSVASGTPAVPATPKPPVDVVCTGPFAYDFVRYRASVYRDVEVTQLNPEGPCDKLTCNQLDVHFAPKIQPDAKPEPIIVDPGKRQQRDMNRGLEAAAMVAMGHPAIAISPARRAEARGERIQVGLREQRMRVEGGSDTRVTDGPNVIQAPVIDYQKAEKTAASRIGQFRATGPGSLHYVPDETKPNEVFQAAWQKSVQLGREQGQPVVVMEGRPELAYAAMGSLIADQIRLYLREISKDPKSGPALNNAAVSAPAKTSPALMTKTTTGTTTATPTEKSANGGNEKQPQTTLTPDRLYAIGHVEIASPQLTGRTQQLIANFQTQTAAQMATPAAQTNSTPGVAAKSAGPNATAASKSGGANGAPTADQNGMNPNAVQPQQTYQAVADRMKLEVLMDGQKGKAKTLTCDGNVVVHGMPIPGGEQQPLDIKGSQLFVDHLDTNTPHITVRASAPGDADANAKQRSQVGAHGVTLFGDVIEMDGKTNHMWSDGPGEANMLMARDLQGNTTATPTPVNIHWQGGLRFDGQTITFDRDVVITNTDSTLHCDRMLARLASPVQFGQHMDQSATSVSQIDCDGQVTLENVSRDAGGVTSHDRMQIGHLTINQQTGAIRGDGPGTIRSTRFGGGQDLLAGPQQPAARNPQQPGTRALSNPATTSADGSKLHFLRVDFRNGFDGNSLTREVTFHERVRAVYGPVDSWEQELPLNRPESLPTDSTTLSCDDLRVSEDPTAPRTAPQTPNPDGSKPMGPMQLQANGDVRIEGQAFAQGQSQQFRVQSDRASYEQAKDMLILEGNTRTPARLWKRNQMEADSPPLEARKIYYSRSTNQARAENIQYLEINPTDVQKAQRPQATAPQQPVTR